MKKTLYVFWPLEWWDGIYYLLTSEGYLLASHMCSNVWYAKSDLLLWRPERLEKWKEFLKDWFDLEIADEEKKKELQKLNNEFNEELMKKYAEENNL